MKNIIMLAMMLVSVGAASLPKPPVGIKISWNDSNPAGVVAGYEIDVCGDAFEIEGSDTRYLNVDLNHDPDCDYSVVIVGVNGERSLPASDDLVTIQSIEPATGLKSLITVVINNITINP